MTLLQSRFQCRSREWPVGDAVSVTSRLCRVSLRVSCVTPCVLCHPVCRVALRVSVSRRRRVSCALCHPRRVVCGKTAVRPAGPAELELVITSIAVVPRGRLTALVGRLCRLVSSRVVSSRRAVRRAAVTAVLSFVTT